MLITGIEIPLTISFIKKWEVIQGMVMQEAPAFCNTSTAWRKAGRGFLPLCPVIKAVRSGIEDLL
jgi:hypothetical protein